MIPAICGLRRRLVSTAVLPVPPSFIRSIGWNMLAGFWGGALVLVSTPLLVVGFGVDRFGIVGLWVSLQVVLGLFDFGLSATLGRDLARADADHAVNRQTADVLATFERCAWSVAVLLIVGNLAARTPKGTGVNTA